MTALMRHRAVFLDKDGTLVRDVPYNADPARIEWRDGVFGGLSRLASAGFALVLVTNQSGIAQGRFSEEQLHRYFVEFRAQLARSGVLLADLLYCPHHPAAAVPAFRKFCACRKPNPGLLVRARARLGIDLERSWMVGDLLDDVEAGVRAGCRTALVHHDGNEEIPALGVRRPHLIAADLASATDLMLRGDEEVA
jgi:D,D-heptose 1,7-bisphosphate phosphatase